MNDPLVCPEENCWLPDGHEGLHVPLPVLWQEAGYVNGPWGPGVPFAEYRPPYPENLDKPLDEALEITETEGGFLPATCPHCGSTAQLGTDNCATCGKELYLRSLGARLRATVEAEGHHPELYGLGRVEE